MPIVQPLSLSVPFARDAAPLNKNTVPNPSQVSSNPALASYATGFPPLTMVPVASGGLNPYGQDFNGVLNDISGHTVWSNSGGRYKFNATHAAAIGGYPLGAVLQSNDGQGEYASMVANNVTNFNTTPASIGTLWRRYAGSALLSSVPVYTEDQKWDLLPVGHVMEFFDFIVGFTLATWLTAHPKWRSLSDYTGRLNNANTLFGTSLKGRASALPSATRASYALFGDENAQLIAHTHVVPATSHTHLNTNTGLPGWVGLAPHVGSLTGNDTIGSGVEQAVGGGDFTAMGNATIPAQTTTSAGTNAGVGENIQPTYYVPKIIKILP
jgi:hypothetical protein